MLHGDVSTADEFHIRVTDRKERLLAQIIALDCEFLREDFLVGPKSVFIQTMDEPGSILGNVTLGIFERLWALSNVIGAKIQRKKWGSFAGWLGKSLS